MPPRRQPSRSSLATEDTPQPHHNNTSDATATPIAIHTTTQHKKPATSPVRGLEEIMGGDPEFADRFFGEPANMKRSLPGGDAEGDAEFNVAQVTGGSPPNGNMTVPHNTGHSAVTIENTPLNIDGLIIQQLMEDLEAYRYDYQFCRSQLEGDNVYNISPAEQRTFQLRMLDLGHQMRMLNHRVQLMQASMLNQRHVSGVVGRAGAATANAYYGAYPPGTSVQPNAYATGASLIAAGGGGGNNMGPYQFIQPNGSTFSGYSEPPQERRGPGRPAGSKNRPRPPMEPGQSPAVPTSGSAKAAALASAGAKRDLPTEIRVATPNGHASGSVPPEPTTSRPASRGKPAKRARLDVQVGSPLSNSTENDKTATSPGPQTSAVDVEAADVNMDDATEDEIEHAPIISSSFTTVNKKMKPHPTVLAAPTALPSTPMPHLSGSADASRVGAASPHGGPAAPGSGPRGSTYTRLGHWMCTLCTSQKYLQHPAPKQPSEPSNWPLRDVSKIVTHYTRMHSEHNVIERCMELGAALDANRGPFKYWVEVTKKTHFDEGGVDAAIESLLNGRLPDVLRRLSQAANAFPKQD